MDLKRFRIVENANQISEKIWHEVSEWNHFNKDTVGRQLVRAADSISANLSEAYGRYSFADRKRFCYYARGSLCETINWIEKSMKRNLITSQCGNDLLLEIQSLSQKLYYYMRSLDPPKSH